MVHVRYFSLHSCVSLACVAGIVGDLITRPAATQASDSLVSFLAAGAIVFTPLPRVCTGDDLQSLSKFLGHCTFANIWSFCLPPPPHPQHNVNVDASKGGPVFQLYFGGMGEEGWGCVCMCVCGGGGGGRCSESSIITVQLKVSQGDLARIVGLFFVKTFQRLLVFGLKMLLLFLQGQYCP